MHVISYSPNFAPPHFAAHGIPKNTPHSTMEGNTAYIYVVSLPLPDGALFFLYTKHTLFYGLIFFVRYGKVEGILFRWANFSSRLYVCER
jgi:hypothetical protein